MHVRARLARLTIHFVTWVAIGAALPSCRSSSRIHDVEIATSVLGGTFYPLGKQLAWLLEQGDYASIRKAQAVPTEGSIDNIELLLKGTDLALAGESKLLTILDKEQREDLFDLDPEQLDTMAEHVATLAKLYTSVLHVVAGPEFPIEYVRDLKAMSSVDDGDRSTVYIGGSGSGTRRTARALLEKLEIDILGGGFDIDDSKSYIDAAEKLVSGDIDLVFFLEAMPSEEVEMALAHGCRLIRLVEPGDIIPREGGILTEIPKFLYQGQTLPIETIGDPAYLVARSDLDAEVVVAVLDALFDNAKDLATGHFIATDIRKSGLRKHDKLKQHPGVELFEQRESSKLLIATAGASGSYYETGKIIQGLLEDRKLQSMVLQTNGSLENLTHLAEERPALAIVQYDVALAAHSYDARAVYKVQAPTISDRNGERLDPEPGGGWGIPKVNGVSRVATLYDEAMYIFARTAGPGQSEARFNLARHDGARVCFGPPDSGAAILARAVFGESQGKLDRAEYLSTDQMNRQLRNGHLDIGFAVQNPIAPLVPQLLANADITLVPIGPEMIERIRGSAIQPFEVDRHYGVRQDGDELITTIKTNAVLIVNEYVSDTVVETIAEAIIAGSDLFPERGKLSREDFLNRTVTASSSIKLHPAAEEYYKKNNLLPTLEGEDWLQLTVHLVGLVLGLASLGSLALAGRNQRRVHAVEKEVVAVDPSAGSSDSVTILTRLRAEACAAVKLPWWKKGVLSPTKWRSIDALIEQRIALARQLQTRSLAKEIEYIEQLSKTDPDKAREEYVRVRNWVKKLFGMGEVDAEQCDFLLRLLPP